MESSNNGVTTELVGQVAVYRVMQTNGLIIDPSAFERVDGMIVPLVWRHDQSACVPARRVKSNREGAYIDDETE